MYLEKELELLKSELARVQEFSCMAAFKVFDYYQKGYLIINDFQEATKDLLG